MTTDLSRQIRVLIDDGAPAISVGEIIAARPRAGSVPRAEAGPPWGRRPGLIAPVAAAVAVTLIVVLAQLLPAARQAAGGLPRGLPRYYVLDQSDQVVVRATATGAVTATIPSPGAAKVDGVAAGGGAFIAAYQGGEAVTLYSFRLTSAGHVTGFSPVKGGPLYGFSTWTADAYLGGAMAVSPGGSQVALQVCHDGCGQAGLMVVNLKTGAHELQAGGLQRAGLSLQIGSISWASSTSLVFLGLWLRGCSSCAGPPVLAQVRTLDLSPGGGPLTQGHILLSDSPRYPHIFAAQISPGGTVLTLLVMHGPPSWNQLYREYLQVIRVPLTTAGQPRVLYHALTGNTVLASLSSGPSGRYWLLTTTGSGGWLDHGQLHLLAPRDGSAFQETWQQ